MGVIVRQEYVCDYCSKPITEQAGMMGRLAVRKQGARGLGREVMLALHPSCSDKLVKNASAVSRPRRSRRGSAEGEAAATGKRQTAKATRRRRG
ncbi:MAG: hypothetical protein ACRDIC_09400 [bacterium]